MIHIMMDINEHQDQRYTRGDNNGRDLYLLGVNVLVFYQIAYLTLTSDLMTLTLGQLFCLIKINLIC